MLHYRCYVMKRLSIFACFGFALASPLLGQLVISSLNQNGQLTWTNAVSNANYRVEWASSATGAWHGFELLTNLSSITATGESVTVQVPMFYRVVWTDAPRTPELTTFRNTTSTGESLLRGGCQREGFSGNLGPTLFGWLVTFFPDRT